MWELHGVRPVIIVSHVCSALSEQPKNCKTTAACSIISRMTATTCLLLNIMLYVVIGQVTDGNKTYQFFQDMAFLAWISHRMFWIPFTLTGLLINKLWNLTLLILRWIVKIISGSEIIATWCFCLSSHALGSSNCGQFYQYGTIYLRNWPYFWSRK